MISIEDKCFSSFFVFGLNVLYELAFKKPIFALKRPSSATRGQLLHSKNQLVLKRTSLALSRPTSEL